MKKIDSFLSSLPRPYIAVGILLVTALVLYGDLRTGPRVPFTVFYLALLYLSLKHVGSRFAYVFVLLMVLSKVVVKNLSYPDEISLWLKTWQFVSSLTLYSMVCYLLDTQMTKRRRAEAALDELSNLHESIVSTTDTGVVVFKSSGECVLANEASARILGFPIEQIRQSNFTQSASWQGSGLPVAAQEVLRTGAVQKLTIPAHLTNGRNSWIVTSLCRIARHDLQPYLLLVITDISAFKEAELAMLQARQTARIALDRANAAERRIISISEDTQRRIGQELHDDLGQRLTGVAFMSELLSNKLRKRDLADAQDASKITALINDAISKTRELAQGLYPQELREASLPAMLERLAGNMAEIYRIECVFTGNGAYQLDDSIVVINLYRIAQEAVNNAVRHGKASNIALTLTSEAAATTLEIADNGCGIDNADVPHAREGLGMHSMQYRASLLGASLHIRSTPGCGTNIAVILPAGLPGASLAT